MKIDYVITGMDIGGAETLVVSLLISLHQRGHCVRLISLTPPVNRIATLQQAGIPVISLEMKSKIVLPIALMKLVRIMRKHSPDIIHGHMFHANIMVRLLRFFFSKTPIVCTAHSTYEGNKIRDYMYRITNALSDLDTVVSEAARQRFLAEHIFQEKKTISLYNCIDTALYVPAVKQPNKHFKWLSVGRLVRVKNHQLILQAILHSPKSELIILGEGEERANLQAYIDAHHLNDRVRLVGQQDNVVDYYQQADGFVLASDYEGFALVVAEAMSCGLPVVVTDSGGPTEIIGKEEQFGKIVAVNDVNGLSVAMQGIEKLDCKQRQINGCRARERIIEHFSLSKRVSQWEALYSQLQTHRI